MGICYTFYNPDTLEEIDEGKYSGMPFFNENVESYGLIRCALRYGKKQDDTFGYINWSIDENSETYHYIYDDPYCSDWTEYITRECALKMQEDMSVNEILFTGLMDRYKCDALIMDVSY